MGTEEDKLFADLKPKDPAADPTPAPDLNAGLSEEFHGKSLTEMAAMVTEGRQKFVDLDRRVEGLTKLLTEEPEKPDPDPGRYLHLEHPLWSHDCRRLCRQLRYSVERPKSADSRGQPQRLRRGSGDYGHRLSGARR